MAKKQGQEIMIATTPSPIPEVITKMTLSLTEIQKKMDELREQAKGRFINACRKMGWTDVINKILEHDSIPTELHVNSFQHDTFFAAFHGFTEMQIVHNKHLPNGTFFFSWGLFPSDDVSSPLTFK